jgi:hypothetical protein
LKGGLGPASRVDADEIAEFVSGPEPFDIAELRPHTSLVNPKIGRSQ